MRVSLITKRRCRNPLSAQPPSRFDNVDRPRNGGAMSRFNELVDVVRRLRGPDGCPWDREQTPQSLRGCLLEESYEVLDALDRDDPDDLRDELGDLLLQV